MNEKDARHIITSLRGGTPPDQEVQSYSVGQDFDELIKGIKEEHLKYIDEQGGIRFIHGSWGAGKTHLFRLVREVAFEQNCLVSEISLNADSTALNKIELIFYSIVENLTTRYYYTDNRSYRGTRLGCFLQESLAFLATGNHLGEDVASEAGVSHKNYETAVAKLMADHEIDIDFKKIIQSYWQTFLSQVSELNNKDQTRSEILQWFRGEGTVANYRKRFAVNKIITMRNARLMFPSLAEFIKLSGYKGLIILVDETHQTYTAMRGAANITRAHNNLLELCNNPVPGLFFLYATTPDFFKGDNNYSIEQYAALRSRIGMPLERPPRAQQKVWNLDRVNLDLSDYQTAAKKIRDVYAIAYPTKKSNLPLDKDIDTHVYELYDMHPPMTIVSFRRLLVIALVGYFEDYIAGELQPTEDQYKVAMDIAKTSNEPI